MRKLLIPFLVIVILCVAFEVRVHNLGVQSLWNDEGIAYGHSQRTLAQMIPLLQHNVHVPAYFGSLALWEDYAGSSEFALRFLSVLFSLLSVAWTYALGKRLYGKGAGLVAIGLVALNTFSIYYAQETRMYAMLSAVGACSMWVFLGFTRAYLRQQNIFPYALALALVNAVGIYTHFSYALVMVAQGVMAVLWLLALLFGTIRLDRPYRRVTSRLIREGFEPIFTIGTTVRALLVYAIANGITIALFSPWISIALRQTSSQPSVSDTLSLDELLRVIFGWLSFGNTFDDNAGRMVIAVIFFLLFGLVFLPSRSRGQWWRLLLPVVWVIVSIALYVYLNLYGRYLRFLLPAEIGFALWIARGVWVLWHIRPRRPNRYTLWIPRFVSVFATATIWFTLAQGIPPLYDNPTYQRDDFRGLAQTISTEMKATDAVIVSPSGLQEIFGYYYRGSAPVYALPSDGDPEQNVKAIVSHSPRIDVVFYGEREQDPQGVIENTLNRDAYAIDNRWWDDARLVRYATASQALSPKTSNIRFGDAIELASFAVNTTVFTNTQRQPLLIDLQWTTTAILNTRYKVFVQVLNADGQLVAQRDSEPANGSAITTDWLIGTTIDDHHALLLDGLPSGDYTLIVGLYDANTGVRLTVANGDYVTLETLTIQ